MSTDPSVTFSEAVVPSSVSFAVTAERERSAGHARRLDSTDTVATFTPTSPLAAEHDLHGDGQRGPEQFRADDDVPYTYSFTTAAGVDGAVPVLDLARCGTVGRDRFAGHRAQLTLGVTFQPASNGTITGVRFYKEADNTGTHTGQPVEFDRDAAGDRHVHQ